jgi:hypothetical protein
MCFSSKFFIPQSIVTQRLTNIPSSSQPCPRRHGLAQDPGLRP